MSKPEILIVDDDPRGQMAMRELLQDPGYSIVLAESGEEALRRVLKQDFAVILLDVQMPRLDGFETAKLLRERGRSRSTPIIFLTGVDANLHSMFRGYELGAVDYIVKPPVPDILKFKIAVFVDLHDKNAVLIKEVAERKRAEGHLRMSEKKLRTLAAHLQSVREEEWTRISREIHDELGQALTGLKMDLMWIIKKLPTGQRALVKRAESMTGLLDDTIQSVREIASRLRPAVLDKLGLTEAIGWLVKDIAKRTGIRSSISVPPNPPTLDPERSTAVFRICQELLTNVVRHANAGRIHVEIRIESSALILLVEDNGKGIDSMVVESPQSVGLLGVQERVLPFGGTLEITGIPDKGTKVRVSIPLDIQ